MSATYVRTPRAGRIFTAATLEEAALDQLRRLLSAYGDEVAGQHGMEFPTAPRSYTAAAQLDKWVEDQLPAVVVVSPGTSGRWEMRDGCYSAVFGLVVGVYVSASTQKATHDLVRLWPAAVRACLAQTPSLGGLVTRLEPLAERYDERPAQDRRTLGMGSVAFEARVNEIVNANAGALQAKTPPDDTPWPLVQTTDVQVDRLEDHKPTPSEEPA